MAIEKLHVPSFNECYDCGLEYGVPGWTESTVHNDDWRAILQGTPLSLVPSILLCTPCILVRAQRYSVALRMTFFVVGKSYDKHYSTREELDRYESYSSQYCSDDVVYGNWPVTDEGVSE